VALKLRLRNGERRGIRFGDPESSKQSVYALMDDAPEVALLPIHLSLRRILHP
jgi:hypothetical protein